MYKLLNENSGISSVIRAWTDVLYNEIIGNPNEKTRLIIDGYDYPDIFKDFSVDYFVVDFTDDITGYNDEYSGIDKDGNYVVLLYIQNSIRKPNQYQYSLKTTLNHELKHAYEDYRRIKSNSTKIVDSSESRNLYTKDFIYVLRRNDNNVLVKILKYYYYTSKIEFSAFLENIYDGYGYEYERLIREILKTNFNKYLSMDLSNEWDDLLGYDIPLLRKFKTVNDFIKYSENFLKNRAVIIQKKINKMKFVHNNGNG